MRRLTVPALAVLLATTASAEVRVYQPPEKEAPAPAVSRGITAPAAAPAVPPPPAANAAMNPLTGQTLRAEAAPRTLEIFIDAADLAHVFPKKLDDLRALPELRQVGLVPEVYLNPSAMPVLSRIMSSLLPGNIKGLREDEETEIAGLPEVDFAIDAGGELAQSYGIQNQSAIVYRDPTGAVRLYNLNHEVEKLQRQLAREIQGAQPAR